MDDRGKIGDLEICKDQNEHICPYLYIYPDWDYGYWIACEHGDIVNGGLNNEESWWLF